MERVIKTEQTISRRIILCEEYPLEYTLEANQTVYCRVSLIGKFPPFKLVFYKKNKGRVLTLVSKLHVEPN